jgi:hypothetical protein
MGHEPLVAPSAPVEPAVQVTPEGHTQPAPSVQQQRLADDVFTEQQGQVFAALLAAQTGLGVLHNLIVETGEQAVEKPAPARRQPRPGEEEER